MIDKTLKARIITIIISVALLLIIGVYFYTKRDAPSGPQLYGVAMFQMGGIGSEDVVPLAYVLKDLNSSEVGNKLTPVGAYVSVYFKDKKEMWASCGKGYKVADASSSTENPMLAFQSEVGIEILDQQENALQIACSRL